MIRTRSVSRSAAEAMPKPFVVSRQADCSGAIPGNTGERGWVVVTTPGAEAGLGDLLLDSGTGTGLMKVFGRSEGRSIAVTDDLDGGAVAFRGDRIYIWDADSGAWAACAGDASSSDGSSSRLVFYIFGGFPPDSSADAYDGEGAFQSVPMPESGCVRRLVLRAASPRAAGMLTAKVSKDGIPMDGSLDAVLDGSNPEISWKSVSPGTPPYCFMAGQMIGVRIESSPDWGQEPGEATVSAEVWISLD